MKLLVIKQQVKGKVKYHLPLPAELDRAGALVTLPSDASSKTFPKE